MTRRREMIDGASVVRTIWFTLEQDRVLQMARRHTNRTFASLVEESLGSYVPRMWGVPWPAYDRPCPRQNRARSYSRAEQRSISVAFTLAQDRTLSELYRTKGARLPDVIDAALGNWIEAHVPGAVWPINERRKGQDRWLKKGPAPLARESA